MFKLATLFAATALAAPLTIIFPGTCAVNYIDASFDDLPVTTAQLASNLPTPYDSLVWQGFQYETAGAAAGVIPHSAPNYGISTVVSELNGTPMLTTNYQGSRITDFTLQNFQYGCVLNGVNGAASVATSCFIEVTGYRGSSNSVNGAVEVCSFQLEYQPGSTTAAQMAATGAIYGCYNLNFAIFQFSLPGQDAAANPDLALLVDDVNYYTRSC